MPSVVEIYHRDGSIAVDGAQIVYVRRYRDILQRCVVAATMRNRKGFDITAMSDQDCERIFRALADSMVATKNQE